MTAKKKTNAKKEHAPRAEEAAPSSPITKVATEIRDLIEAARSHVSVTANLAMVSLYWNIGRIITQEIQREEKRAGYGDDTGGAVGRPFSRGIMDRDSLRGISGT